MTPEEKQAVLDEEHLRLLAMFHYIAGGLTIAGGLAVATWAVAVRMMFATMAAMPPPTGVDAQFARQFQEMPAFLFVFSGLLGGAVAVYGILQIVAGRCLAQRRGRIFTIVAALPRLIFIPAGTLLSVFTLIVLERDSVQRLYAQQTRSI